MDPFKCRLLSETTHLPSQLWQVPVLMRSANRHHVPDEAMPTKIELPTDDASVDVLRRVRSRLLMSTYRSMGTGGNGGKVDWNGIFAKYDQDHNGELDIQEFTQALRHDLRISPKEVGSHEIDMLFRLLDNDSSGSITVSELLSFVYATGMSLRPPQSEVSDSDVRRRLRAAARKCGVSCKDWRGLFQRYAQDGSGAISLREFRMALRRDLKLSQWELTERESKHVYDLFEGEGENPGLVNASELVSWLSVGADNPDDALPRCTVQPQRGVPGSDNSRQRKPTWARPWLLERGLVTDGQLTRWLDETSTHESVARKRHHIDASRCGGRTRSLTDLNRHTARASKPTSRLAIGGKDVVGLMYDTTYW